MSIIGGKVCDRCDGRGRLTSHAIDCCDCNGSGWKKDKPVPETREERMLREARGAVL